MRRIEVIRWGLLIVGVGFIAALGVILGRARSGAKPAPATVSPGVSGSNAGVIFETDEFEYTQTVGDRPVFRVKAKSNVGFEGNWQQLRDVKLTLFGKDGSSYDLVCERASIQPETREAIVEGNVRISQGTELWLKTEKLKYDPRENALIGQQFVLFKVRQVLGRSRGIVFLLNTEELILKDDVWAGLEGGGANSQFAAFARANRFQFDARTHVGTFDGNALFARGGDTVRASRIVVTLSDDEKRLREVAGEGGVRARFQGGTGAGPGLASGLAPAEATSQSPEQRARAAAAAEATVMPRHPANPLGSLGPGTHGVSAQRFVLAMDGDGRLPHELTLLGSPAWIESQALGAAEPRRRLTAPRIEATFSGGELSQVRTTGGVVMAEQGGTASPGGQGGASPGRQASATAADFTFDVQTGELANASFNGAFEFRDAALTARGAQAILRPQQRSVRVASGPGRPAELDSPEYRLTAAEIEVAGPPNSEVLSARGAVRATVKPAAKPEEAVTGMFRRRGEPIFATSEALSARRADRVAAFTGRVRAWQGENVLSAKRLELDQQKRSLAAAGDVKTVLYGDTAPRTAAPVETVITAQSLDYLESNRIIRYRGEVVMKRQRDEVRAAVLEAHLDRENRVERVVANGKVIVTQGETGRRGEGDEAVYRPEARVIELTGKEVVLTDPKGNRVRGSRLTFDMKTQTVNVQSSDRGVTETVYTP